MSSIESMFRICVRCRYRFRDRIENGSHRSKGPGKAAQPPLATLPLCLRARAAPAHGAGGGSNSIEQLEPSPTLSTFLQVGILARLVACRTNQWAYTCLRPPPLSALGSASRMTTETMRPPAPPDTEYQKFITPTKKNRQIQE